MTNYEQVHLWASAVTADRAWKELSALKQKYPWLKCDESLAFVGKMAEDLPKLLAIIKLQEKQNEIDKKYIEVNKLADEAIVKAIQEQYGL